MQRTVYRTGLPALIFFLAVSAPFPVAAEGAREAAPESAHDASSTAQVIATTPWTAAFVLAAGVEPERIRVLAPYELRHPPEYELAPSDVQAVSGAELIVFAGYEVMMERLRLAVGGDQADMLKITTTYGLADIRESVMTIADRLGTREQAQRNLAEIEAFFRDWEQELAGRGLRGAKVIAHQFHKPLADELGFEVIGTFGPGPLEARRIAELSATDPALILDNWHNDVGRPLRETMPGVPVATMINFPGHAGTRTILDVLRYNRDELNRTLRE